MNAFSPVSRDIAHSNPERSGGEELLDLTLLARTLWFKKFTLLAAFLLGFLLAFLWASRFVTPKFYATSVLIMEQIQEPSIDLGAVVPGLGHDNSAVNTEVEILRSRTLIGNLVDEAGLMGDPEFNPKLTTTIGAEFEVWLQKRRLLPPRNIINSEIFDGAIERTSTIDRFTDSLSVRNVPDSRIFEVTVESADREKAAFLSNLLSELYIKRQLGLKFDANETAINWLRTKVSDLGKELEKAEKAESAFAAEMQIVNPDTLDALKLRLLEVRQLIDALEQAQARSKGSRRSEGNLTTWRIEEADLSQKIIDQSQSLVKLAQLKREAEASRLIYQSFLARLKETAVQQGVHKPDSVVLSKAEIPESPSFPRPILSALIGGAVAFLIVSLTILRLETGRKTLRSVNEIEGRFKLPVLGQVRKNRSSFRHFGPTGISGKVAEDIRAVRSTLLAHNRRSGNVVRSIVVTSATPNDGKTSQVLALAQMMSELGKRVLIIEADLRKGLVAKQFSLGAASKDRCLKSVLVGKVKLKKAAMRPKSASFFILPAGQLTEDAATLLSGTGFQEILNEATELFDLVIVDTPPVLAVPDATLVAPFADQTLFILKWNSTTEMQIQRSLKILNSAGVMPSGFILSHVNQRIMRRLGTEEYFSYT